MVGPYRIIEQIGAGGGGVVYRATDGRLKRDVAIKVLVETFGANSERLAMFTQEAQAVAGLTHPNILTLHDFGTERGIWYSVTELLHGHTLRARLADGPLPVDEAVEHAIAITQGLSAAHARNIVHRDLKPENLFVTHDGRLKILDFGIAKVGRPNARMIDDETTRTVVAEPSMSGTLRYMSPEQLRGQDVDHRSDLFALGTILYEMLTGRHPFLRASSVDTVSAILRDAAAPLPTINPAVPASLDRVVRRSLKKLPSERFQSAGEIVAALETIREVGRERDPNRSTAESHPDDSEALLVSPPRSDEEPAQSRSKWLRVTGIVAGVALLAAGTIVVVSMMGVGVSLAISRPTGGTVFTSGLSGIRCGTGGTDCVIELPKRERVELLAVPDDGFAFAGFTGDCAPAGRAVMTQSQVCGAIFTRIPNSLTEMVQLTVTPPRGGTIVSEGITCGTMGSECSMNHPQGKLVSMKALADPGFSFKGFTGEGCSRSGEAVMSGPRTCGAVFARATDMMAANRSGQPAGRAAESGGRGAGGMYAPPLAARVPPPPTPEAIAKREITGVLELYRSAFEARDLKAIRAIYPAAPPSQLSGVLGLKAFRYTYLGPPEFVLLDPALGTATVKISALLTDDDRGPQKHALTVQLLRRDGRWTISQLTAVPDK